jgi:hypothetical protein
MFPSQKIRRKHKVSQYIYSIFWKWAIEKIGQNLKYDLKYLITA